MMQHMSIYYHYYCIIFIITVIIMILYYHWNVYHITTQSLCSLTICISHAVLKIHRGFVAGGAFWLPRPVRIHEQRMITAFTALICSRGRGVSVVKM